MKIFLNIKKMKDYQIISTVNNPKRIFDIQSNENMTQIFVIPLIVTIVTLFFFTPSLLSYKYIIIKPKE
jgi:hypothetical protein